MAAKIYDKIPIVDTARRCGLVLDSRTLRRKEVEASCPFCGDHGPGKYHLSLNTDTDQYRCNLCGAHGNSVSLYARIKGICNKEAYLELAHESKVYPLPQSPSPQTQERQPCSLEQRHAVYSDMLAHLTLLPKHGENLLERGLSEERIRRNEYRSMPETEHGRRLLADLLRSHGHDLHGIPGFRTYYGDWTLSGPNGFLIPVRNKDGLIQGLKIRLDDAQQANRKYRWLSSRNLPSGTRSYSWVHVTGNTQSKRAFLTEGPLKGDVASFLAQDALFICEEPETSQHSENQKKLINALIALSTESNVQVIVTTHSAVLVNALDFKNIRLICADGSQKRVEAVRSGQLPFPSLNEVNYLAFSEISEGYHDELYGYLEEQGWLNEYKQGKTTVPYKKISANGTTLEQQICMTEYIRHQIHHPENKYNARFNDLQLRRSIEDMRAFVTSKAQTPGTT